MLEKRVLQQIQVELGQKVQLSKRDTRWVYVEELKHRKLEHLKQVANDRLQTSVQLIADAQELLYAANQYSVLFVLQGMDASGKDGTIKHVMSGINPQGCSVHSFKQPSVEELSHSFLWRYMKGTPAAGSISIFNRSYYEETLVQRVHPEWVVKQHGVMPANSEEFWKGRFDDINAFERHLAKNSVLVLKFFLHISKQEQKDRLLERLNDPKKHWKFSQSDIAERQFWDQYEKAYEKAITATNTEWAPWYIIPADYKWAARALIAEVVAQKITSLGLKYPETDKEKLRQIEIAKAKLDQE